ncbi:MAG TPA: ABC transporter permease [Acidobacteriota bacterium]|nr:ABC transporter permease [Acidobacteriota bacterium]
MGDLARDLRFGVRQLIKSPGFTVAAVACLALGIGANSAAFSFVRAFLHQTAPIREPESLVCMYLNYNDGNGAQFGSWSYPDLLDMRDATTEVFDEVLADTVVMFSFSAGGQSRRIFGTYVTGNHFDALGVAPALGRTFLPEEDQTAGTHPVAVLNHRFWSDAFGADPGVVGRSMLLNGREITVIGVAPANYDGNNTAIRTELWIPFNMEPGLTPSGSNLERRGNHWIQSATGRLRRGVTVQQAKTALDALYVQLQELYPDTNTGITIDFFPESEAALHPAVRGGFVAMLTLLSAVVGFVLLLTCANVAGLLIARSTARTREVAIRLALGAGKARLVRQLLTESTLLSLLGGALGVLLGVALIGLVKSFQPPTGMPLRIDVGMDVAVLTFTFVVTAVTGVVFGLAPAISSTRQDLVGALKDGAPGSGGRSARLRDALVVGQVALCLVLLIAAGMVLRSLQQVRRVDLGFNPDGLIHASIDPALQGYPVDELDAFFDALRTDLLAQPGIQAVGYSGTTPLSLMNNQTSVLPEGYEVPEGRDWPGLDYTEVDHGYFAAMGIPIVRGRAFAADDDRDAARVAIVNQAFADRFWPDDNAVGKQIRSGGEDRLVVGVVPTGKYFSLGEDPKPFYYGARAQQYRGELTFVHVRTAGDSAAALETVRRTIQLRDPTLPVSDLDTGHGSLGLAFLPARLAAGVVAAFAVLALLLAAVGLYGVISFAVAQGFREIGIRMAVGARAGDVIRAVMWRGIRLSLIGLGIGLVGGLLLSRAAANVLYGVSPTDPAAYGIGILVLGAAATAASFVPALRATRIDPLLALRTD